MSVRRLLPWILALGACEAGPDVPESPLDRIVPEILAQDRIPSAVVVSGNVREVTYRRAFGEASLDSVYDLASCTKVVATTTAAMLLVEEGKLGLDDPVSRHLREFAGRDITIAELLAHRSGLPAYLTPKGKGSDAVLDEVATLRAAKTFRYS